MGKKLVDLSILIPARNEMFLKRTVEDILGNIEADTEIIVILDGDWPTEGLEDDPHLSLIYHSHSVGQRAATNEAARMASGKYLMKLDAHCAMDKGFDRKLLSVMQDDWTLVPIMRNLHAFNWICPCGWKQYQGPTPLLCPQCQSKDVSREVVWYAKPSPQSKSYCFDSPPHFQYFGQYSKRPEGRGPLSETMSLQGSAWMLSKERYFELNICDESIGSWGSQGIEVACKTWLSGGKCMVYHETWYAHMFRTQGGDFGFPYPLSGRQVDRAKSAVRKMFFDGEWAGMKKPLSWLIEKFWPVPGWSEADLENLKIQERERWKKA